MIQIHVNEHGLTVSDLSHVAMIGERELRERYFGLGLRLVS